MTVREPGNAHNHALSMQQPCLYHALLIQ